MADILGHTHKMTNYDLFLIMRLIKIGGILSSHIWRHVIMKSSPECTLYIKNM